MSLFEPYEADLREMIDELDERGVFDPGEREAWDDGVDDAERVSDLMMLNDSMVDILGGREEFDEYMAETDFSESRVLSA